MWTAPRRVFLGAYVNIHMDGQAHDVTPESWVLATKYAISLYLRASEMSMNPTLRKLSSPCPATIIGSKDGVLDLSQLCIEGIKSLRNRD